MQVDDKQTLIKKKQSLMKAISEVVEELVKNSGKSGRKISEEYDIGLGVISKLERSLMSDVKFSTVWRLANAFNINPVDLVGMIVDRLPDGFNFYE